MAVGPSKRVVGSGPTTMRVIPAERAGHLPGERELESSKLCVSCYTQGVVYWVPARARPAEPGSLGRDDIHMR
jgi:hypothetical protein